VKQKVNEVLDDNAKIKKLQHQLKKYKLMIEEMARGKNMSPEFFGGLELSDGPSASIGSASDPLMMSIRSSDAGASSSDSEHREMIIARNFPSSGQASTQQSIINGVSNQIYPPKIQEQMEFELPGLDLPPFNGNREPPKYKEYTAALNTTSSSFETNLSEELSSLDSFRLDSVPEEVARKTVVKYMKGKDYADSSTEEISRKSSNPSSDIETDNESGVSLPYLDVDAKKDSLNATARTEDETYDGPPASYRDVSFKFGSHKSLPDTLGVDPIQEEASKYGTADNALDGRSRDISWDTMGLNTSRPEHTGQPMRTLKSLEEQHMPIPKEVTIISTSLGSDEMCITEKLEDAQKQATFLNAKLEASDDIIEYAFKDLERARLCIHDLVYRNVQLAAKLKEKRREDVKEEYEEGEVAVENYWLLKGSMYAGLFFFFSGGYEYFMASVIFVWLVLETDL
jgi:hypothetical protein